MKLTDINIRDPFILPFDGTYYLYGTRAKTAWGKADGFDGYTSSDLKNWEGPYEIFHRPDDFWADEKFWAPEVHIYKEAFYMFATFGCSSEKKKGTMILKADNPLGPFAVHSDGCITPRDWNSLDGTFYLAKNGRPYMVFCHEWVDIGDGAICCVQLSEDLKRPVSGIHTLFHASEARPWGRRVSDSNWPDGIAVTDGPFLYRKNDYELLLLWATFGEYGYAEGIARSENGEIDGCWNIDEEPLFAEDGGHGMVFTSFSGKTYLVLHQPNETPKEHPVLIPIAL